MDVTTAGAYLSLSEHSFRVVAARAQMRPVNLGLRLQRYRKSDLDKLVRSLAAEARGLAEEDTAVGDQAAERALARVARRSSAG